MSNRIPSTQLFFHGSSKDFDAFEVQVKAVVGGDDPAPAPLFFTPSFKTAGRCGCLVYVVTLDCRKTFHGADLFRDDVPMQYPWPAFEARLSELGHELRAYMEATVFPDESSVDIEARLEYLGTSAWDAIEANWMKDWLKSKGYDSFVVTGDGEENVAVFSPDQICIVDKVVAAHGVGSALPQYAGYRKLEAYTDLELLEALTDQAAYPGDTIVPASRALPFR